MRRKIIGFIFAFILIIGLSTIANAWVCEPVILVNGQEMIIFGNDYIDTVIGMAAIKGVSIDTSSFIEGDTHFPYELDSERLLNLIYKHKAQYIGKWDINGRQGSILNLKRKTITIFKR